MAKRRTKIAARRAQRKADKLSGIEPSGKSHYAKKRLGQVQPKQIVQRPSWFVRHGWAAIADAIAQRNDARDAARAA